MSSPLPSTSIKGILRIAKMIANNIDENSCDNGDYHPKMSHKEVIALARIALTLGSVESFGEEVRDYVDCLLWSILTYGFNHFTRSFAAKQIVITLEDAMSKREKEYGHPFPNEF